MENIHTEIFIDDDGTRWTIECIDGEEDLLDIVVEIAERNYLPRYL